MAQFTVSRGGDSVTGEIWAQGGELLVARDVGKPNSRVSVVSREDPRTSDHRSALDVITLIGVLSGDSAYSDAQSLAEDLVKPHSGGSDLSLDITDVPGFDSSFTVGVPDARSLELDYRPGVRDRVDVQMSLPIVNTTIG